MQPCPWGGRSLCRCLLCHTPFATAIPQRDKNQAKHAHLWERRHQREDLVSPQNICIKSCQSRAARTKAVCGFFCLQGERLFREPGWPLHISRATPTPRDVSSISISHGDHRDCRETVPVFLSFHYRLMLPQHGESNESICVTIIFNNENHRPWQRNDGKYHITDYRTCFFPLVLLSTSDFNKMLIVYCLVVIQTEHPCS